MKTKVLLSQGYSAASIMERIDRMVSPTHYLQ